MIKAGDSICDGSASYAMPSGCPAVSAHDLRKATDRRLAEIGCTEHQIAAILGHAAIAEVQR
jgi:integrase